MTPTSFFQLPLALLLAGTSFFVQAQDEDVIKRVREKMSDSIPDGWVYGGVGNLNFSQVSLTNWNAGGQNSISINGLVSLYADYKKDKNTWQSTLDVAYGILRQGGSDARFIKTDDRIDLFSKYGRKATGKLYYAAIANFRTQMAPGFSEPTNQNRISEFLAPAYLLTAAGFDYEPTKGLRLFISPATGKFTYVGSQTLANQGAFGVESAELDINDNVITPGQKLRSEIGGYVRAAFRKDITKHININTRIDLFSNYLYKAGNIDVDWLTLITFKVNEYINASFSAHLIYDDDIDIGRDTTGDGIIDSERPRTQFKQIIAIGLTYKFKSKPKE